MHSMGTKIHVLFLQRTWKEQLRNDFKNRRRPLTSLPAIQAAKEKFGRKRPRDHLELAEVEALKRRKTHVRKLIILSVDV